MLGNELRKHVENAMRTGWEHIGNQKIQYPTPSPKEEKLGLLGVCCNLSLADQNTVIPFQVWHLGSELLFYISKSTLAIKKIVYENLAMNIVSFFWF